MPKTIKTYSLNAEIAEKFDEQTSSGKTSQKVEELMADFIDQDMEENLEPLKIPGQDLTKKRKKLLKIIVEEDYFKKTRPQICKKVRKEGVYTGDSGSYHFRQAIKALIHDESVPVELKNDKLVPTAFNCMNEGCERDIVLNVLARDYECSSCGRRYAW